MESSSLTYLLVFFFIFYYCLHRLRQYHRQISYEVSTITCEKKKAAFLPLQFFCFEPAKQR